MDYNPDDESWSPASWLGASANVLYNEYLTFWQLQNVPKESEISEQQRAQFRHLHSLAEALTLSLHSLRAGSQAVTLVGELLANAGVSVDVNEDFAARIIRAIHAHPIIRDGIKLDLALHAADVLLAGAETRATDLLALVADRALSDRASAFLDRATRLYVWGFEPETIIMCASVLEAAYEERFPPEEMFRLQIPRKGVDYEPFEYERAALAAGLFSKDDRDRAARIRRARNDIIHNAPDQALKSVNALRYTALLLDRLFPGSAPGA